MSRTQYLALVGLLACAGEAGAAEYELLLERQAELAEQVLFEQDLRRDARVGVIPVELSGGRQRYRIIMDEGRAAELGYWLQAHGFHVQATDNGWRVFP